ncbi:PLP-dependent aminotransferase family protein [Streptomyces durbertensis]|uniref:aminotransferase-like domain-containing protein n=1 Tax=Streptomyces durbertensis TaxID=2448886 RepID=UPI002B2186E5|nr:PLP-dependent aminotransferase family protein [Streptomyces durbertensis]
MTDLLVRTAPAGTGTGPAVGAGLSVDDLHASLNDPALTSMTLLNEITGRFPEAVSFAAGRPYEGDYAPEALHRYLDRYTRHLHEDRGFTPEQVARALFQYGDTKGVIADLVARQLAVDEGLAVDPTSVVVTTGCQEAMVLLLRALRRDPRDVVFAAAPTYVGFTGAARLVEMPVRQVREGRGGLDPGELAAEVRRARAEGLNPRACYVVPDFANPGGATMSTADRERLLRLAEREGLLLIEDNPYSMFHDGGRRPPTLKALDRSASVVYVGSFSKTAFPGARIGYLVADQPVWEGGLLADQLAKIKSMLTLNTSSVAQAVIGGMLLEHGHSLERASASSAEVYRRNRRAVLDGLARRFPDPAAGVRWNDPTGGLFVVVTVPFEADDSALEVSAGRFGVLWTPMHHFYAGNGGQRQLRLSVSVLTPEEIDVGLDRLKRFVADRSG